MVSLKVTTFWNILGIMTFLSLSANLSLYAQKFEIGPAVGLHVYTVAFENDDDRDFYDSKFKIGYKAGAFISFPLKNDFSWTTEFYYSKRGRKVSYGRITNNADYNFLEVSPLLRKKFDLVLSPGVKGKWFINVGPNIAYWLNGKGVFEDVADVNYDVVFDGDENSFTVNNISNANRYLFGLEVGIGGEISVLKGVNDQTKKQDIQVELRFNLGQTFLGGRQGSEIPNLLTFEDSLRANYRIISLMLRYSIGVDLRNAKKGKSTLDKKKRIK